MWRIASESRRTLSRACQGGSDDRDWVIPSIYTSRGCIPLRWEYTVSRKTRSANLLRVAHRSADREFRGARILISHTAMPQGRRYTDPRCLPTGRLEEFPISIKTIRGSRDRGAVARERQLLYTRCSSGDPREAIFGIGRRGRPRCTHRYRGALSFAGQIWATPWRTIACRWTTTTTTERGKKW